jgi:hypothetical protein
MTHDEWNQRYPVGTHVIYRPVSKGPEQRSKTIGLAYRFKPGFDACVVPLGNGVHAPLEQVQALDGLPNPS